KLAKFFLSSCSKRLGKNIDGLSQTTMVLMLSYSWPATVRDLQNVMERAVVLTQGTVLELQHELAPDLVVGVPRKQDEASEESQTARGSASKLPSLKEVERNHILAALKLTSGVIEGP